MNKNKIIVQLLALLQDASAQECELALIFVEHMIGKARDNQAKGNCFTFTSPDAINIAYIVQRSQDNPQILHEILIHARAFEKVCRDNQKK